MKKVLSILLIFLFATSMMFAGGAGESQAPKGKTVVEIWSNDRHDLEYLLAKVSEFNAKSDTIEIKHTTVVENYPNMLVMGFTSGNAPDLFYMNARGTGFDLKTFVDANMLTPYPDSLLDDPEFAKVTDARKNIVEGVNAINGVPYAIFNVRRSGTRMIYNVDLFKKAGITKFPTTLAGLVEAADKVTKVGNGQFYGIATCASAQFERWLEGIINKSGVYHYDFKKGVFNFDGYREGILLAQKFFSNGSMFPGSNTQGVDAMRAQFANGTFGIWGNASQEAGVFTDQFPIEDFEWAVAELPSLDGTVKGTVDSRPQKGLFMFSSSKNKDAAWEVVKYLNSEEVVKGYIEKGYALPLSTYMQKVVDMSGAGRLGDFAPVPYEGLYPSVPAVTVAGDNYAVSIWNAIVNGSDVDRLIADLNKRYNEALERDLKIGKVKRIVIPNFDPLNPNKEKVQLLDK
ncbi:MAG: extracellular solute-binding protein [Spirochaetota bacterium]|nr:extracellular solute-binding protein [Spirochaetota bacterium]